MDELCSWNLPTDAFVEILLRLSPIKRWRLRLVCRHWRDVIHERTPAPERLVQPVPLAFVVNYEGNMKVSASAYAIHDLEKGRCTELCRLPPGQHGCTVEDDDDGDTAFDTVMVGACNGLLCLCDNTKPGGAIYLVNPVTKETVAVPRLPGSGDQEVKKTVTSGGWHEAYSFTYEPMTERYKIVHVPCYSDRTEEFHAVQVFTLGEESSSWRDVPVPGRSSCCLDAGIVSIDGATYWVTAEAERLVVSFDLKHERFAFTKALPARAEQQGGGGGYAWRLTKLHGRLGIVSARNDVKRAPEERNEVLVLERGKDRQQQSRWIRRCSVQVNGGSSRRIARPLFVHGDHVLTSSKTEVFAHRLRSAGRSKQCGDVRSVKISEQMRGTAVTGLSGGCVRGMFTYVKTKEPLGAC